MEITHENMLNAVQIVHMHCDFLPFPCDLTHVSTYVKRYICVLFNFFWVKNSKTEVFRNHLCQNVHVLFEEINTQKVQK